MSEFADHFSTAAAGYAAHRPTYPPALVQFLAAHVERRDLAWDCGCGSGQLSVPLAAHFARVVATDASAAQIGAAAPHPGVEYRCAVADASGLGAASVDLAVAAQAAHWFDLPAYYAEIRRVARPGALVVLVAYAHAVTGDAPIDACLRKFHSELLAPYWPAERRHVDDGYQFLSFPFTPVAAPELWIDRDWTAAEFTAYASTWSAVRALERTGDTEAFTLFATELAAKWGSPPARRPVRWLLAIRAGRV